MRIVELKCPSCDAKITVETDKNFVFCHYCGTQIYIDDGIKRSEHTRKIVDVAKLRAAEAEKKVRLKELEYEYEERKNKREYLSEKAMWSVAKFTLIAMMIMMILVIFFSQK